MASEEEYDTTIRCSKVLAVEGKDEIKLFKALMRDMGFNDDDFEIRKVGGISQFKTKIPALVKMRGFSDVKVLALVRDAEGDADAAFQSIRSILLREKLDPPERANQFSDGVPKVGIFIMPGNSNEGMLESLCLSAVKDHPAMKCVDDFIDCASRLDDPPKNPEKAKCQAFLAAMPKIVTHVGLGAQKGYWSFESDEWADLKLFLDSGF